MPRHQDSPETRRLKSIAAKEAAAEKRTRKRWYITINVRPAPAYVNSWGGISYRKLVWPILFRSEEAAWEHARSCPAIWNPPAGAKKVVSYALSTTYLPKAPA